METCGEVVGVADVVGALEEAIVSAMAVSNSAGAGLVQGRLDV